MKVTKKYKRISEVYKYFAKSWDCDLGNEALIEMFLYESRGEGSPNESNGYFLGKKWMDVNVSMWREDMRKGLLFPFELYDDPDIPNWFLNKVLV